MESPRKLMSRKRGTIVETPLHHPLLQTINADWDDSVETFHHVSLLSGSHPPLPDSIAQLRTRLPRRLYIPGIPQVLEVAKLGFRDDIWLHVNVESRDESRYDNIQVMRRIPSVWLL
jgi:hypothetical protein